MPYCIWLHNFVAAASSAWLQMVEELLEQDGLCIMAAGLGWQKVAAVLMRIQIHRRRSADLLSSHPVPPRRICTIAVVPGVYGLC